MSIYARVRDDYPLSVITAFGGREYTKKDWRPVPAHEEETARRMAVKSKDSRAIIEIRENLPEPVAPKAAPAPAPTAATNASKTVRLVRRRQGVTPDEGATETAPAKKESS